MSDAPVTAETVSVATPDGEMQTYVAEPASGVIGGLVVVFMGGSGIREEFRAITRRIAAHGHLAALPDLYHRAPGWRSDPADTDSMYRMMASVTRGMVDADVDALLTHLDAHRGTAGLRVGCVGFCWGGQFPLRTAGRRADRVAAAVSLYGTELVDDREDSPHRQIPQVRGEVHLLFAAEDPWVPRENAALLDRLLEEQGVAHRVETLPRTEHGFLFTDSPAYREEAAEAAWADLLDLLQRRLSGA
jgi:carboxymethylenebutenolidase